MRVLTVLTDAYLKELDEATLGLDRRAERGGFRLCYEAFDAEGFYSFLDWAAFQENAALKGLPKLAGLARGLIPPSFAEQNAKQLGEYVKRHRALHVEGYVRFRMAGYNDYINRLLYAVIKKTKA